MYIRWIPKHRNISIHALRREGDVLIYLFSLHDNFISIHALRREGDFEGILDLSLIARISIHALRREGDYQKSD